jgi:hypothetical protein
MDSDNQEGNSSMEFKGKPKVVEISISKQSSGSKEDPKMAIKKQLLNDIKSMAMKSMKDNFSSADEEMNCAMDMAKGHEKSPLVNKEEESEESEEMEDEEEVSMLPEDQDQGKEAKLAALLKEMEELKDRIKQIIE